MEILKDIDRTIIIQGDSINGKQKEKLKKILRAISHNSKDVGYVQGLNQIVGTLIPQNLKENEIYWIVLYFLKKLKLKEMYKEGFPRLKILTFQLEIFMQNYLPELLQYLKQNNISVSYFCTKWFITLFSYDLENKTILKIWNLFLIKGWKVLIRIALGLLKLFEKNIRSEPVDNLSDYIRNFAEQNQKSVDDKELIKISFSLKVTNRLLLSLQNIYEQHTSYNFNVYNLNILLFQNHLLNNVYDWKILPQAPHFDGLNSILERLNAHTMVADYINELSSIQSQRRSQRKQKPQEINIQLQQSKGVSLLNKAPHKKSHQRSLSSTRHTNMLLNQFDFPQTSVNDIRFGSNKKEQTNYDSRRKSITHTTESDEPGFLKLIQNKIISIFNNQDQQQQDFTRQQNKSRIEDKESAYSVIPKPTYIRQSSTPQILQRNQTQTKYYDQILEDYKEINDQYKEEEDLQNKNKQAELLKTQQLQQKQEYQYQQQFQLEQNQFQLQKQLSHQKQQIYQQQQINQVLNTNMADVNEFDYTYTRPKQTFTKYMIMQKPANLDKIQQNQQFIPMQQQQPQIQQIQSIQAQMIPTMKIQQMQQRQQQIQIQPFQSNQIKMISPSVSPDFRTNKSQMHQQRVFIPQQQQQQQQQIQNIQRIIPLSGQRLMLINQKF